MKGLLLKDLYLVRKYFRIYFIIAAVFIGVSCLKDENIFFIFYPCVMAGLIPINLISYDERDRWSEYAQTLPFTRAQLVSAKYIMGLCMSMAAIFLAAISQGVRMIGEQHFIFREYFALLGIMWSISLISPAVVIPLVYRFGVEKGSLANFVLIVIIAVGGSWFVNLDPEFFASISNYVPFLLFCTAALLFSLSWAVSVWIYQRKEIS